MKVLYVAPQYPNRGRNAAQVRANALLARLRSHVELRVLAFPVPGEDAVASADASVRILGQRRMTPWRMVLGTLSGHPRAFRRFDSASARAALLEELREFRPDLVHFDTMATLGLLNVTLSARPRPAIVAHTHDAVSRSYKARTGYGGPLYRADKWREYRKIRNFETRRLADADIVVVDSPEDAEYLRGLSPTNVVETLPLGFEPTSFSPDGPKADLRTPALVFSGSFASDQTADAAEFLVRSIMPRVWASRPDAHLYLVGANPRESIRAMGCERVHVTGFVDDMASYLRAATVYVCPLRLGSGMRTRVVEALACGAPMVATPMSVRGLAQADSAGPPWQTAETADEFAEAIRGLLSANLAGLRERAAAYARDNYSWDSVVAGLVRLYDRVNSQGGGGR